jgi:hypothetical protein
MRIGAKTALHAALPMPFFIPGNYGAPAYFAGDRKIGGRATRGYNRSPQGRPTLQLEATA